MKRILVPTDFSDVSLIGISSGAHLAAKTGGQLVIIHVVDEPANREEKQAKLHEILHMPEVKNVTHHYKEVMGDPIDAIVAEPADIIVMGSSGASGLRSFFVGTNAEKVAKNAKCPVITLKEKTDFSGIMSIVYATDMRPDQAKAMRDIKEVQSIFKAKLHLVKVYDDAIVPRKDVVHRLETFASNHQLEDFSVTARPGFDEAMEILRFADEIDADMIAMITHDRDGLARILGGYISGDVINSAKIAIWTKAVEV